jgi:hypothetical protein
MRVNGGVSTLASYVARGHPHWAHGSYELRLGSDVFLSSGTLVGLAKAEPPLISTGRVSDRGWVIGYHPKWASFQHYGAARYSPLVAEALVPGA